MCTKKGEKMTVERAMKYLKIIENSGEENQKNKAIEELQELIDAIKKDDIDNIAEEVADVHIMLTQLSFIYNFNDEYMESLIDYKLNRTLFRMGLKK